MSAETRKLATVLFCDLVGSTALGERLDPEAVRRVQLRYFETCEDALRARGGTIEKFIGDAVLCVFGTPVVREDDAIRGCRAALDLVAAVEGLNTELETDWGVTLAVRVGVNSGVVVAGDPSRGQVLVTGDVVNTAARLEQAAGPATILIGSLTRELIGADAICAPVPSLRLKGKSEPVAAWRLIACEAATTAVVAGASAPLSGRAAELELIGAWLTDPARAKAGGAGLILGAPGLGKTRLLRELAGRTTRRVLASSCPPHGEGIVYAPISEWLATLGDENVERLAGAVAAGHLRVAAGQEDETVTVAEIEAAARALVSALADESLLLVVEDVHWAEPAMLDLLATLATIPGVVVLMSARPELVHGRPDLASRGTDLQVRLDALSRKEADALLSTLSSGLTVSERERLLDAAEGNPLILGQLARHLAEGGDANALPPGLDALLQARVEGLSAEERTVAERAAVMGREFWDSGVAALAPDAPAPTAALAALLGRELVARGRADLAPEAASPTLSRGFSETAQPYSFTHMLIRDAVYAATPKLRRADLHERLAGLLQASGAPDELLAFHLERAARLRAELRPHAGRELAVRAAERFERAGERALLRGDRGAARALLTRAGALLLDDSDGRARIELSLAAAAPAVRGLELVPGDVFAGCRVVGVAGRGGMGVVYRAEDLALGREVALKLIAPQLAGDPRFRERFARESRLAARLEHPNVVPVYSAGDESGQLYIAMRLIDGTDLQAMVRTGALPPGSAAELIAQVAGALDAAHGRGLIHRDVKPANVLVSRVGGVDQAFLTDFGLSRDATTTDGLTHAGQWVGTLAYMAPEQIRAEPLDARADIYALGAVLYQCLTGCLPFPAETDLEAIAAHLDNPPPRPSDQGAPRAFDRIVERALSKDRSDRYRSAGDLGLAALAAARGERARLTERSVATGPAASLVKTARRRRSSARRPVFLGVGAGGVLAAVAAIAIAAGAFSSSPSAAPNAAGKIVGAAISVPDEPDSIAAGNGQVWTLWAHAGYLTRLNVDTGKLARFNSPIDLGGGSYPNVGIGEHAVWVTHDFGSVGGVDRFDAGTGQAVQHITFPYPVAVSVGDGAVWAVASTADAKGEGRLARIDPASDRVVGPTLLVGRDPSAVGSGAGAVWVANRGDDSVWRVDPTTRAVTARIAVGDKPSALTVGAGGVWVVNSGDNTVTHIDPGTSRVQGVPISLGKEIEDIVATNDAVWVSAADGTVTRLDPQSGAVVGSPFAVGRAPLELAADGRTVWVASATDQTLTRIEEKAK